MSTTYAEQRTEEQKLYDEEVLARVRRGIAFCEKEYGEDWADHIDMGELKLCLGDRCILGQLENKKNGGNYHSALDRLGKRGPSGDGFATAHGFAIPISFAIPIRPYIASKWEGLEAAWVDVLTPKVEVSD